MPRYFGWRYIWWLAYTNALTILATLQLIFLQFTMDDTLSRPVVHWLLSGANILGIVIAQIKRNHPPGKAPTKRRRR